jgi:chromosome partitioning protein
VVTRILAIANQKGGVAKTTTVASLGAALVELGRRVLLVDLDPQACLTFSLGLDPDALEMSVHDVLLGRVPASMVVQPTADGPDVLPATIDLAGGEVALLTRTGREYALRAALEDLQATAVAGYDDILLDCPPSLGVLTLNGLTAATEVLVPLQCETLSHRGVGQLLDTVADVQRLTNRGLTVLGVLPTLYDGRTTHARAVLADISTRYGLPVVEPAIAKSVRFAEAPAWGRSVLATAARTPGAQAYRQLAARLVAGELAPSRVVNLAAAPPRDPVPVSAAPARRAGSGKPSIVADRAVALSQAGRV